MSSTDETTVAVTGGPGSLRFRIFKRGTWRRAFRLEDVFWDALESAAKSEQKKLGDFVKQLTDSSAPDANISSLMRVRAMEWLNARCADLEAAQDPRRMLQSLMAAPVPSFVISASRELVSSNAEFTAFVTAHARPGRPAEPTKVHMSLDVSVQKLIDLLVAEHGRPVACGFSIKTSDAQVSGRARLALVQPQMRDLLVGYVLDEGRGRT
jgi:predicted DNA-binding ribbon-helix-helix protein